MQHHFHCHSNRYKLVRKAGDAARGRGRGQGHGQIPECNENDNVPPGGMAIEPIIPEALRSHADPLADYED
jgi:hypothetical protein